MARTQIRKKDVREILAAFTGDWDSGTSYVEGDIVVNDGSTYIALADNLNSEPPSVDWQSMGSATGGATGATGANGATGATGVGATGATGSAGVTGATGSAGGAGATGATGAAGTTGATGVGTTGATGSPGLDGTPGSTGATGTTGGTGGTGATGGQGSTGATGTTGGQGSTGATGTAGAVGSTGATGAVGSTGATGTQGGTGATGADGAIAMAANSAIYTTDMANTDDDDPGSGKLRFNDDNMHNATRIFIDLEDADTVVVTSWLDSLDDSTNSLKGVLTVQERDVAATGDFMPWITYNLFAVANGPGYRKLTVEKVASSVGSPTDVFADATSVFVSFAPAGNAGATGTTGATGATGTTGATGAVGITGATGAVGITGATGAAGATGATGAVGITGATGAQGSTGATGATGRSEGIPYIYDTATGGGDPGAGKIAFNTATLGSIVTAYFNDHDSDGNDETTRLTSLDDSTSTWKTTVTMVKAADPTNRLVFNMASAGDLGAFIQSSIDFVSLQGSFADEDPVLLFFSRTGDKGTTGDTGAQGATGVTGATGAAGNTGAVGATGTTGATGANGAQGATGVTGGVGGTGATGPAWSVAADLTITAGEITVTGHIHRIVGGDNLQTITGQSTATSPLILIAESSFTIVSIAGNILGRYDGASPFLNNGEAIMLIYDATLSQWIITGRAGNVEAQVETLLGIVSPVLLGASADADLTAFTGQTVWVTASGNSTLTLPDASNQAVFLVQKTDDGATQITLDPTGTDTINGQSTYKLRRQFQAVMVYSDGTNNYRVMAEFAAEGLNQTEVVSSDWELVQANWQVLIEDVYEISSGDVLEMAVNGVMSVQSANSISGVVSGIDASGAFMEIRA